MIHPTSIWGSTIFILHCYGQHRKSTLTEASKRGWKDLVVRASFKDKQRSPGLKCLLLTEEASYENVKRAYLQMSIWLVACELCPLGLQSKEYGWLKDPVCNELIPTIVSSGVELIPEHILKISRCGCKSDKTCSYGNCPC